MKYVVLTVAIILLLPACSGFKCSIGAGYRKLPEKIASPLFPYLLSSEPMKWALTPSQIELILNFLGGENFKSMFPTNSRVDLGAWVEISANND